MLTLQGPRTGQGRGNYSHRQSLAKCIWNLLGFTGNLDLK